MSSFTSLALHPTPVVSFNIAVPSRTYDAVAASRHFNLHILADDAPGAAVADWFAQGNYTERGSEEDMFGKLVASGIVESVSLATATPGPIGGRDYTESPVLHGDGILFVLRCNVAPALWTDDGTKHFGTRKQEQE
ncbi:flavin reductase like domain-containing protein [Dichotomopilus funicola]|uniref:Flavin reductase like domain-containing protein n=1 Tax=Dichotomopilus funicola TaxID=1934379 RepID=A0AAN6ZRI3_9PEZI|nr:flavin reductase like domain-containing protein [Dichotomopilus funicola]